MKKSEAMERFKQFCLEQSANNTIDADDQQDWFSLSLGFFVALGVSVEDAQLLAIDARYKHQYWSDK